MTITEVKERLFNGEQLLKEEIKDLFTTYDLPALCELSGEVTHHFMGNYFDTCSIVNARSGRCSENCQWCAQSIHFNTHIHEYEMISKEECVDMAGINARYGVNKFSFVTSGRSLSNKNIATLCEYADEIKDKHAIALCASLGLLSKEQLAQLKAHQITRYHCNLESSPRFFATLCTTHSQKEKIATIHAAQELSMEVCSGGIIGMGETMDDRLDLALLLRELGILSIPINVLNPIPGTPLEHAAPLTDDEVLLSIVAFRLINPTAFLRFAGGRKLIKAIEIKAICAGVNSAIVGDLLTTIGSNVHQDMEMIKALGYTTNPKE